MPPRGSAPGVFRAGGMRWAQTRPWDHPRNAETAESAPKRTAAPRKGPCLDVGASPPSKRGQACLSRGTWASEPFLSEAAGCPLPAALLCVWPLTQGGAETSRQHGGRSQRG